MITNLTLTGAGNLYPQAATSKATAHDPKVRLLCGIWASFFLGAAMGAAMFYRFKEAGYSGLFWFCS
jgi:hypothetical protein